MQATIADLQSRVSGIQSAIDSQTTRWQAQLADAAACGARVAANDPSTDPLTCSSLDQQAAMSKQSIDMQAQTVSGYNFQITQLQNSIYNLQHPSETPLPVASQTPTPTPIPTPTMSTSPESQHCIDYMNSLMEQVNNVRQVLSGMRTTFLEVAAFKSAMDAKGLTSASAIVNYYVSTNLKGPQTTIANLQNQYTSGGLSAACAGALQWQSFDNSARSEVMTRLPEDYNTTVSSLNVVVAKIARDDLTNVSPTPSASSKETSTISATELLVAPIPTISVAPSVAPVYNKPTPKPTATKAKQITIVCTNGKKTVKVTAEKPVCPKGYKKK